MGILDDIMSCPISVDHRGNGMFPFHGGCVGCATTLSGQRKKKTKNMDSTTEWETLRNMKDPMAQFEAMVRYADTHDGRLPPSIFDPDVTAWIQWNENIHMYHCYLCDKNIASDLQKHRGCAEHLGAYQSECASVEATTTPLQFAAGILRDIPAGRGRMGSPYWEWNKLTQPDTIPLTPKQITCTLCDNHVITKETVRDHSSRKHTNAVAKATDDKIAVFLEAMWTMVDPSYANRSPLVLKNIMRSNGDVWSVQNYRDWCTKQCKKRSVRTILPKDRPRLTTRMTKVENSDVYQVHVPSVAHLPKTRDTVTCALCHVHVSAKRFLSGHNRSEKHMAAWNSGVDRNAYLDQVCNMVGSGDAIKMEQKEEDPLQQHSHHTWEKIRNALPQPILVHPMKRVQHIHVGKVLRTNVHPPHHPAYPIIRPVQT
jgi:hypothetical protein